MFPIITKNQNYLCIAGSYECLELFKPKKSICGRPDEHIIYIGMCQRYLFVLIILVHFCKGLQVV